jgi:cytochrome P450
MEASSSQPLDRVPADIMQAPYDILARFREKGPVQEVLWAHGAKVYLVTRYDEVRALTSDPRVSKDGRRMNEMLARQSSADAGDTDDDGAEDGQDASESTPFADDLDLHMLNSDPPRHTRLRALVSKAFTPQRVERLRPHIEELADRLLDKLADQPQADLVDSYAIRIPITIICELFGIPEQDREPFRLWALKLVGAGQDPQEVEDANRNVIGYANSLVNARRADPGDDMVSELLQVREGGSGLTQGELVAMIFVLVVAGHITTIYSIASSIHSLLTHPDELAKLKADPSLMPAAVDELLRFDGAAGVGTFRFTKEDIPIGDTVIPAGKILALSWHAGNRDGSHFPDADRLDLDRHPLGSMAFGHGLHYCIGVPLAKMQIEIALDRLITRFPDLRLACDPAELRWDSNALLRGLLGLPVTLCPHRPD